MSIQFLKLYDNNLTNLLVQYISKKSIIKIFKKQKKVLKIFSENITLRNNFLKFSPKNKINIYCEISKNFEDTRSKYLKKYKFNIRYNIVNFYNFLKTFQRMPKEEDIMIQISENNLLLNKEKIGNIEELENRKNKKISFSVLLNTEIVEIINKFLKTISNDNSKVSINFDTIKNCIVFEQETDGFVNYLVIENS